MVETHCREEERFKRERVHVLASVQAELVLLHSPALQTMFKGKYTVRMAGYAFSTAAALGVEADKLSKVVAAADAVCGQLIVSEGAAYVSFSFHLTHRVARCKRDC